jgi:glycosyltransferase 2 family protein
MKIAKSQIYKYGIKLIGIVLFLIILSGVDFTMLFVVLKRINLFYFILTILLIFPFLVLKMWRWNYILKIQRIKLQLSELVTIYLSSLFLGVITPGRIGDFAKIFYLKKTHSIPIGKGLSGVFVDRLLDLCFLALISIGGGYSILYKVNYTILVAILFLFIIGILFFVRSLNHLQLYRFLPKLIIKKGEKSYYSFKEGILSLVTAKFLVPIFISILIFSIFFVQCYLIARSIGINIGIIKLSIYLAIVSIITLVPVSISGIGTRDVALIYLFSKEGLTEENAIAYSLIFLFVFSVITALIGFIKWYGQPKIIFDKDN